MALKLNKTEEPPFPADDKNYYLERAKLFQTEMLNMCLHPNNFLPTLKSLLSHLTHRFIRVYSEV